jgi:hypothetical protein
MATKTITTCDLCKQEILGRQPIYLSVTRFDEEHVAVAEFLDREFCGEGCALAAVRGLLNGAIV